MAHYKRRKPRIRTSPHVSMSSWRKKNGLKPINFQAEGLKARDVEWHSYKGMMNTHPRTHDILFHNRPRRRAESRELHKVMKEVRWHQDPDGMFICDFIFPLYKKPHQYYW
jgi:hypothetical protein